MEGTLGSHPRFWALVLLLPLALACGLVLPAHQPQWLPLAWGGLVTAGVDQFDDRPQVSMDAEAVVYRSGAWLGVTVIDRLRKLATLVARVGLSLRVHRLAATDPDRPYVRASG